jgi:hypothetical protein
MSRLDTLIARYERSAALTRNGIELDVVGDAVGAHVDSAVRAIVALAREDKSALWDDVLGPAKALRWRLITQPHPARQNRPVQEAADAVAEEAGRLTHIVGKDAQNVLKELVAAAMAVTEHDSAVGGVLLESIEEVGASSCVIVAANNSAAAALESWLAPLGVAVLMKGQLASGGVFVEQAYVLGPPAFFPSSLVTAPTTEQITYLLPAWFEDREIPRSALAPYAEGAIRITGRTYASGDVSKPDAAPPGEPVRGADLMPQAVWSTPAATHGGPGRDEVAAQRVLLSGGYSIMLDNGEWIRAVDPTQPGGERVITLDIGAVREGTYLLLRDGETERRALYDAALELMGGEGPLVEASQTRWKDALRARLEQQGHLAVEHDLNGIGVRTFDRVWAWPDPMLVRPQRDRDFELLLEWLGIPVRPAYGLATKLRKRRAQASANIAAQLEVTVGAADMAALERDGHIHLDIETEGFRGLIATRVLAISPNSEIIQRRDARVPIKDRSAEWLG